MPTATQRRPPPPAAPYHAIAAEERPRSRSRTPDSQHGPRSPDARYRAPVADAAAPRRPSGYSPHRPPTASPDRWQPNGRRSSGAPPSPSYAQYPAERGRTPYSDPHARGTQERRPSAGGSIPEPPPPRLGHPVTTHNGGYTDIETGTRHQSERGLLLHRQRSPKQLLKATYLDEEDPNALPGPLTQVCNWFIDSKFNYLGLAFPGAVAAWWYDASLPVLFCVSMVSLIGMSSLLSSATDQIANHVNQTVGALLNVTFGNAIEMILSFFALKAGLIGVVKYSLFGSIVSNSIWSLGVAFICAGRRAIFSPSGHHNAIKWNRPAAGAQTSVLIAGLFAFALPCIAKERRDIDEGDLLSMSHYMAILLLFCYFSYLYYSMVTHADVFDDSGDVLVKREDDDDPFCGLEFEGMSNTVSGVVTGSSADLSGMALHEGKLLVSVGGEEVSDKEDARRLLSAARGEVGIEFEEVPMLSLTMGVVMLAVVTVLVCAVSEWVCDSIGDFALKVGMSPRFVAFILLPLAGNLPEFVTVVSMAAKGKMDLCVGVAIGSSMQVMTFVVPCMVLMGWCIGRPMNLHFGVLQTSVLFLCVVKAWNIIQKREASWFEGGSLIAGYVAIAIAFWFWTKEGTPDEVGALAAAVGQAAQAVGNPAKAAVERWH